MTIFDYVVKKLARSSEWKNEFTSLTFKNQISPKRSRSPPNMRNQKHHADPHLDSWDCIGCIRCIGWINEKRFDVSWASPFCSCSRIQFTCNLQTNVARRIHGNFGRGKSTWIHLQATSDYRNCSSRPHFPFPNHYMSKSLHQLSSGLLWMCRQVTRA